MTTPQLPSNNPVDEAMQSDDLVKLYQQAVRLEDAQPGSQLREQVLAAAQQAAAQRGNTGGTLLAAQPGADVASNSPSAANDANWKIRALGSIAVLGLVGLLASRFLPNTPGYADLARTAPAAPYVGSASSVPAVVAADSTASASVANASAVAMSASAAAPRGEASMQSEMAPPAKQINPPAAKSEPSAAAQAEAAVAQAKTAVAKAEAHAEALAAANRQDKQAEPLQPAPMAEVAKPTPFPQEPLARQRSVPAAAADATAVQAPSTLRQAQPSEGNGISTQRPYPAPTPPAPAAMPAPAPQPMPEPDLRKSMPSTARMQQELSDARPATPAQHDEAGRRAYQSAPPPDQLYASKAQAPSVLASPAAAQANANRNLLAAAGRGQVAGIQDALAQGATINTTGAGKRTALMMASSKGHSQAVKTLLAAGANPHLRDATGRTAADYARAAGYVQLATMLDGNP